MHSSMNQFSVAYITEFNAEPQSAVKLLAQPVVKCRMGKIGNGSIFRIPHIGDIMYGCALLFSFTCVYVLCICVMLCCF